MNTDASGEGREQELLARMQGIATSIFSRRGVDFACAKRAGGWTNATWIGGGLALRMSSRDDPDRLRREARLGSLLPAIVGFPEILETGFDLGIEWSLAREIQGESLGEAWPGLSWEERAAAVRQVWEKISGVHRVDVRAVSCLARTRAWYNSTNAEEARAGLGRLVEQGVITSAQAGALRRTLEQFWVALTGAEAVLNHGDLTLDNLLWHDGRVVTLLDFEFAVIAPAELDLNSLVKWAYLPPQTFAALPGPDRDGLGRLQAVVCELAQPVLAHPGGKELLLGYAILLELWLLALWLAHPEGEGPLEGWEPYRRLRSLGDGQGGYLAPMLTRLGAPQVLPSP